VKVGDKVFVYGTLKRGHGANDYMNRGSKFVGEDRISAEMFSLGGFPGIRVAADEFSSEAPTVRGELYEVEKEDLPPLLDRYEGYPRLYDRKQVTTETGELAWVYEINNPPSRDYLIPSGVWE
jgi:gamma-glutamylcyclotransferase (GGCT)/AIG2-like uncharacterized protein YtfP